MQPSRWTSQALIALLTGVALWYGGSLALVGLAAMFHMNWENSGYGDCRVDWGAARLFLEHRSPYTEDGLASMGIGFYGFGHPPTTSFWFLPFAKMGYPLMSEILAILVVISLLFHLIVCVNELDLPMKAGIVAVVFGWLLGTSWMIEHVHIVQVSEIIAFMYVLAWYYLRRDREIVAGIILGLACTFKLFPGVTVLFLFLTRRFRGVLAACAAYLPVAVIMTRGFGTESWKLFLQQQAPMVQYWAGDVRNSSVVGVTYHLLRPLCEYPMMRATWPEQKIRELPHTTPPEVMWGTVLSLVLLAVLWLASRRAARSRATIDVPFAIFSAASPFVNVWVWEHYYPILIMPALVVAAAIWRRLGDVWRSLGAAPLAGSGWRKEIGPLVGCLGLASGLWLLVKVLTIPMLKKQELYGQYWALKNAHQPVPSSLHRELHWLEVANWLPWALVIALLVVVVRLRWGSSQGARRLPGVPLGVR
jgi:hypothetical protein